MNDALRAFVRASAIGVGLGAAYGVLAHPRVVRWGATDDELETEMPGDELVHAPRFTTTRAVTVHASPESVWQWLVQIGQGRGGLYSYDWLENLFGLDIHSCNEIRPDLQHLAVGDVVRLSPDENGPRLTVARVDPPRTLVLWSGPHRHEDAATPDITWAFVVEPVDAATTRLVARWRADFRPTIGDALGYHYLVEPVSFVMERRMLLGIRDRAERCPAVAT